MAVIYLFSYALSSVSFALFPLLCHLFSLCFSDCHFQSLLFSLPFPLLTHSELSIAASFPRFSSFPLFLSPSPSFLSACSLTLCRSVSSFPLSLNLLSYFIGAFHFQHPLFTPTPPPLIPLSLFPCSSHSPFSHSFCFSVSLT